MTGSEPLVSIGLPVYNGASYLRAALDCLLDQDYPHLEVIVCDNASTDSTPQICREYHRLDRRLRCYRSDVNRGLIRNHNWALSLARGEYFLWHGVKDLRDRRYVRLCVERLRARPEAVLCYTAARGLDEDGTPNEREDRYFPEQTGDSAARLLSLIRSCRSAEACQGMFRAAALRRAGPLRMNVLPDLTLLSGLAILGPFEYIDEPLHLLRWPEREEWDAFLERVVPYVSGAEGGLARRFAATKFVLDTTRECWRVPHTLRERLRCMGVLIQEYPPFIPRPYLLKEWPRYITAFGSLLARGARVLRPRPSEIRRANARDR